MVLRHLRTLADTAYGDQSGERVEAAVVLASRGQWGRFKSMLQLLRLDWRDVLMAAALRACVDGAKPGRDGPPLVGSIDNGGI